MELSESKCSHHESLVVSVMSVSKDVSHIKEIVERNSAETKAEITALTEKIDEIVKKWEHYCNDAIETHNDVQALKQFHKEAKDLPNDVKQLEKFRTGTVAALWVIYGSFVGTLAIKLIQSHWH